MCLSLCAVLEVQLLHPVGEKRKRLMVAIGRDDYRGTWGSRGARNGAGKGGLGYLPLERS